MTAKKTKIETAPAPPAPEKEEGATRKIIALHPITYNHEHYMPGGIVPFEAEYDLSRLLNAGKIRIEE